MPTVDGDWLVPDLGRLQTPDELGAHPVVLRGLASGEHFWEQRACPSNPGSQATIRWDDGHFQ